MTDTSTHGSSEAALQSNATHKSDAETVVAETVRKTKRRPTLDDLLRMPLEEGDAYLRRAALEAADEYVNDPSVTEFTCLDSEDFEDYPD